MLNNRNRRPTHPGEILREEVLPAARISQSELARRMGVSRQTVAMLVAEKRPVTPDLAHRLGRVFDTTPEVWLNLQQAVDIWETFDKNRNEYEAIEPIGRAANA